MEGQFVQGVSFTFKSLQNAENVKAIVQKWFYR